MEKEELTALEELPEWMTGKKEHKKPRVKIDDYNLKELDRRLGEVEGYVRDFRTWIQAVRG